jgi:hypothetical protein
MAVLLFIFISDPSFKVLTPIYAQVATAPFSADRQIGNPAVLSDRPLRGHSIRLLRESELSKLPQGGLSNLEVETKVDTAWLTSSWTYSPILLELGAFPQQGSRETRSGFTDAQSQPSNFVSRRDISLVPLQAMISLPLARWGSVGIKGLYTNAQFSTDELLAYPAASSVIRRNTVGRRAAGFLLASAGGTLNLLSTGFRVAGAIESLSLIDDIDSTTTRSTESTSQTSDSTEISQRKSTARFRKLIVGAGYIGTWSGREKLRIDLSSESMPSLEAPVLPDGRLYRLEIEAGWEWFQVGLEVISQSGYSIDPRSLIPFFFGTQDMAGEPELSYGFFGGFKSTRGHSFGLSYSQSAQKKKERFGSGINDLVEMDNSSQSFGLSYLYAF